MLPLFRLGQIDHRRGHDYVVPQVDRGIEIYLLIRLGIDVETGVKLFQLFAATIVGGTQQQPPASQRLLPQCRELAQTASHPTRTRGKALNPGLIVHVRIKDNDWEAHRPAVDATVNGAAPVANRQEPFWPLPRRIAWIRGRIDLIHIYCIVTPIVGCAR